MKAISERFWSKVDRRSDAECWPWLAAVDYAGRGVFYWDATVRRMKAPRAAWALTHGEVIADSRVFACHTCDNPNCVNPAHLWLGSNSDNLRDAAAKGRRNTPRPKGVASFNGKKTHCVRGHAYEGDNLIERHNPRTGRPMRGCRQCRREVYDPQRAQRARTA